MAGEWMKMRTNLWDDPRVGAVADQTNAIEATVIGGLYWLWAMADAHTADGWLPGLSARQIDRKTGIAGFGDALAAIGWIEVREGGLMISRFDEHNGQSAKSRAQGARRVAKHKAAAAGAAGEAGTGNGAGEGQEGKGNANGSDCGQDGNARSGQQDESGNGHGVTGALPREEKRREEATTPVENTHTFQISEGATEAGRACVLMRQAGCFTTNPSHPDLIAAMEEGVTAEALRDTVIEGLSRSPPITNPFPWAISTARKRKAQGATQTSNTTGATNANPQHGSADHVSQLRRAHEQRTGGGGAGPAGEHIIDAEFAVVGGS